MTTMMTIEELKNVLPNPVDIVAKLDEYIVGQQEAKKILALLLLNRAILKLKKRGKIELDILPQKSNVMLIGPTGTGKTALIKALAEISDIDICLFDVTSITSAGYIGNKVEDILLKYVNNVSEGWRFKYQDFVKNNFTGNNEDPTIAFENYDLPSEKEFLDDIIETGIIYLDEIDKIRCKGGNDGSNLDVSGGMVQNELLKVLEGSDVSLSSARGAWPKCGVYTVNTECVMFIVGGAFVGLSDIIYKRLSKGQNIGFMADFKYSEFREGNKEELLQYVTTNDLIEYGIKPELLGRVPLRAGLKPLTLSVLEDIIIYPKNSVLKQYKSMFKLFDVELLLDDSAIKELAKKASELKMGARSLKLLFNSLLTEDLYNIFSMKEKFLLISAEDVRRRCE